ncbi:hypothetical protein E4U60_003515 [Claviceps pazoutovae]|uniref:Uncharacterized protein n=1 Tax=Claviceps pazoutovae TaxID=1649127 RepID=A0A9P7SGH1_9HYPO|nr:hypothetical protein E4U60_003515 [Claviceps pazoutovae]
MTTLTDPRLGISFGPLAHTPVMTFWYRILQNFRTSLKIADNLGMFGLLAALAKPDDPNVPSTTLNTGKSGASPLPLPESDASPPVALSTTAGRTSATFSSDARGDTSAVREKTSLAATSQISSGMFFSSVGVAQQTGSSSYPQLQEARLILIQAQLRRASATQLGPGSGEGTRPRASTHSPDAKRPGAGSLETTHTGPSSSDSRDCSIRNRNREDLVGG